MLPCIWEVVARGAWALDTGCHALWHPQVWELAGVPGVQQAASECLSLVEETQEGHTGDKSGSRACSSLLSNCVSLQDERSE